MSQVEVKDLHGINRSQGDRSDGVQGLGREEVFGGDETSASTIPKDVGTCLRSRQTNPRIDEVLSVENRVFHDDRGGELASEVKIAHLCYQTIYRDK